MNYVCITKCNKRYPYFIKYGSAFIKNLGLLIRISIFRLLDPDEELKLLMCKSHQAVLKPVEVLLQYMSTVILKKKLLHLHLMASVKLPVRKTVCYDSHLSAKTEVYTQLSL